MAAEPDGLPAGDLARDLQVPANTLPTHLAVLARAGSAIAGRRGRFVAYRAAVDRLAAVTVALTADCCRGRPDLRLGPATVACFPEREPEVVW